MMEDYNKYLEHQIEVLEQRIENQKEIIKKQTEKIIPENHELHNRISRVIEYIKGNEKEYGSLEENEKIILDILKGGEDNEKRELKED